MIVLAQPAAALTQSASLRAIVLAQTGQDVSRCCRCALCDNLIDCRGVDLATVMQWILVNDERALTNATVWSDDVLRRADHACANQLDIPAVLRALRGEARRRGIR